MLAIITWMTPKWRKQWLVPLLIHCFNQFFLTVFKYFPIKRWYSVYIKQTREFDILHIPNNVRTLKHQHISDIQSIDAKNGTIASCGHDGRVVLWDTSTWTARLDRLHPTRAGELVAHFNGSNNRKKTISLNKKKPRLVKMESNWVAVVYDDTIRVWNVHTGMLVNELCIRGRTTAIEFVTNDEKTYLISAQKTGLLHVWDVVSGDCVQTIQVGRVVTHLHVDRYLYTASRDGHVQCWECEQDTWTLMYTVQQKSAVTSLATGAASVDVLVAGCSDGSVSVWYAETGEFVCELSEENQDDNDDDQDNDDEELSQCVSVLQVVVTKYCQMEYGAGLRCGGDKCNGFLVACSTSDDKVHAWRLDGSRFSKQRKTSISSTEECDPFVYKRRQFVHEEQPLRPTYLGKINQPGGRGIVFCDKMLAGVRRSKDRWEAWFASLQHYQRIPIETFDLDHRISIHEEEETQKSYLKSTLLYLFTSQQQHYHPHQQMRYRGNIHASYNNDDSVVDDQDASENLPFSAIQHVISLNGVGLACDYGNFIKLVYPTTKIEQHAVLQEQVCQCKHSVKKRHLRRQ